MTDSILFAASAGSFVYLGMDPDPAHAVTTLQPGCPYPIKLLAGWVVPDDPRCQQAYAGMKQALSPHAARGNWFFIDYPDAIAAMASAAKQVKGKRWDIRTAIPTRPAPPPSPNMRRIVTPEGVYASAAEAGREHGITRQGAWDRAMRNVEGWRWEDSPT